LSLIVVARGGTAEHHETNEKHELLRRIWRDSFDSKREEGKKRRWGGEF